MQNLNNLKKIIKDYIFPVYCLGCNKEEKWICENCLKQISESETTEFFDKEKSGVKILFSALPYNEASLSGRALKVFKYDFSEEIFDFFIPVIKDYFLGRKKYFTNIDVIIPIPLHPRKQAERGFNQSEKIAEIVGGVLDKEVLGGAIYRVKYTKNQARLNKKEREENIKNAFEVNKKNDFSNKTILLVDDVFTTGSTIHECGSLFKEKKVKGIYAFTLFRGK